MKLKDLSKEDLEVMGYGEITELILAEKKSKMKIVDIFKKICTLLDLSESEFENKIADFYDLISTDKNFAVLEKGYCDLRKNHNQKVIIEEEEEELPEIEENEEELIEEETEEDIFYDSSSEDDDVDDDDLGDFSIEEEEEEASV